jgi:hypothetical protein
MIAFVAAAALAGKWDDTPSDVVAEKTIAATPAAVQAVLTDLAALGAAWGDRCVAEWVVAGDRVTVRYTIGVVRRRVPARLTNLVPDRTVDLEHEGKRGFTSRFSLAEVGGGTAVTMTTFLDAPPWPVTGPYHRKIKPAWEACQAELLDGVARAVAP